MGEKPITRREWMGTLGGLALAAAFGERRAFAAEAPPNILYIMTDDHAAHAISGYGSRVNKTPNLDRIAAEGMRFENAFVTNSLCGPSRATLLTGKYSHLNGFLRNGDRFDGAQQTFPKLLQKAGYQTAMVGKWHLETDPTGFDYWNILPGQGAYHDPVMVTKDGRTTHPGYVTDLITDCSLDWLRKRDKTKPFCLLCHHKAPHRNWQPDAKHAEMFKDKTFPEPPTFDDDWATRASAARTQQMTVAKHLTKSDLKQPIPPGLTPEQEKRWRYTRYMQDYLACIASVDDNVGRMLDFLEKEGLADNTIVVYTTDNGFFLGDHGWFDKRFMFEESLRLPLMIRYPKAVKAGSTCDRFVINADYAPTFLDFAGVPVPSDMQGRSVRPLLEGKTPADWRTSMYYHYYEFPGAHSVQRHYGVRTDQYKLIFYYQIGEWELFDLKKDRYELKNVYGDPAYADAEKQMKAELDRLRAELKVPEDAVKPPQPVAAAGPAATGVQLLLAFNDPDADTVVDGSGHKRGFANHGTTLAEGRKGKARLFDGKASYLDLPRPQCPQPHDTPVTVSAWLKPSKPDGVVLAHGGVALGYCLHIEGGKAAFSTRMSDELTTVTAPEKLPEGWVHVAGHLAKGGKMTLYVNGQPVATAKAPGLIPRDPADGLQIGVDKGSPILDETKSAQFYGGLIGQVKLVYGQQTEKEIAEEASP